LSCQVIVTARKLHSGVSGAEINLEASIIPWVEQILLACCHFISPRAEVNFEKPLGILPNKGEGSTKSSREETEIGTL
jgi:hypothetical protein